MEYLKLDSDRFLTTNGLVFRWSGGAYIDIYVEGEASPFDCINVWDYATDKPRIERSKRGFISAVNCWKKAN